MGQAVITPRIDRRTVRTRLALREALAEEIEATGDLSRVTVTAVAQRAGITRRTFYSHYRDIPDMVSCIEEEVMEDIKGYTHRIAHVTLDDLEAAISSFEPCPGSTEVLAYIKDNGDILSALLGEGGDPAFAEKLKNMVRETVELRASEGFIVPTDLPLAASIFDYYLTFVISAEVGVIVRWLTSGMAESEAMMSRLMTALMFVRPGDLYGRQLDFSIPSLVKDIDVPREEQE